MCVRRTQPLASSCRPFAGLCNKQPAAAVMSDPSASPADIERRVAELEERIGELYADSAMASDLDVVWIIISAVLVFFMQVGFAMVSGRVFPSLSCCRGGGLTRGPARSPLL